LTNAASTTTIKKYSYETTTAVDGNPNLVLQQQQQQPQRAVVVPLETIEQLRIRLPPSVWTRAGRNHDPHVAALLQSKLSAADKERAMMLCGKLLYSSLRRAVQVGDLGEQTFVATGDIGMCVPVDIHYYGGLLVVSF
jgi:hypothetical protein